MESASSSHNSSSSIDLFALYSESESESDDDECVLQAIQLLVTETELPETSVVNL